MKGFWPGGDGPLQRGDSHPASRKRRGAFSRVDLFVGLLLLAGTIFGCTAAPTRAKSISPTASESCLHASVFTARDMQARVDCHPSDYKLQVSKDTVVLFAFASPNMDWTAPVFVVHVPSVSEAAVNYDGTLFSKDYKTPEGQAAIEKVLHDPALMARILGRAGEIQKGPSPPFIFR